MQGCDLCQPALCSAESKTKAGSEQRSRREGKVFLTKATCVFKVVHFQNLLASVPHSESHEAVTRVDLHHAVRFHAVHGGLVAMVVHLQRQRLKSVSALLHLSLPSKLNQQLLPSHTNAEHFAKYFPKIVSVAG